MAKISMQYWKLNFMKLKVAQIPWPILEIAKVKWPKFHCKVKIIITKARWPKLNLFKPQKYQISLPISEVTKVKWAKISLPIFETRETTLSLF
jgi:hypothetical protein